MEKVFVRIWILALIFFLFGRGISFSRSSVFSSEYLQPRDSIPGARKPRVYTTMRLTTARPVIDGNLNDACWKTGVWASDFTEYTPNQGAKPPQRTELKILYDDKNIYVAIRAFDTEPDKIHRYAGLRDDFAGDIVGINFDSYHDHRTGFEFDLTAYGQKIDLVLTNPENWDVSWNPVWYGKTGMEDSAWTAEMEIPLSQLRYSTQDVQVWGMHCWRWLDRAQEESDWEPLSKTGPGIIYQFGELHGIRDLKKSSRLEIMPFTLGQLATYQKDLSNPFADKGRTWSGNAGLDAKIGVSSNFTLDLTVNPDFGQVESDPSVMNLTAFETLYEEKRPFFLEGKTIFQYDTVDMNLFYSRRIGHAPSLNLDTLSGHYVKSPERTTILSAIKLSGKTADGLSIGVLQSITARENAKVSDADGNISHMPVEPLTNFTVARVQKDYHEGNTVIGGIFTSTNRFINSSSLDFLANNAYTGGLDFLSQWANKKYYFQAMMIGSQIDGSTRAITALQEASARYFQRPGASYLNFDSTRTSLGGYGGKLRLGRGTGKIRYSTELKWISPGLDLNDVGYMQTADLLNQVNEVSYRVIHPVSIFRFYSVDLQEINMWNFNSTYLGSGLQFAYNTQFLNKWNLFFNLIYHTPAIDTRLLRGGYDMKVPYTFGSTGQISTDHAKKYSFLLEYQINRNGDHSLQNFMIGPGLNLRPVNTLAFDINANYSGNRNELQYVTTLDIKSGYRYILGTVNQQTLGITFRVDYSITPEFSIQYYGSPFVSRGSYSEFKYVTAPKAREFNDRFSFYKYPILTGNTLWLDEGNDNIYDYSIENPDFNFHQFRSNFVAKWEYRPGSFLYVVWSADRTDFVTPAGTSLGNSFNQLWNRFPDSIFLVKLSYWFSL